MDGYLFLRRSTIQSGIVILHDYLGVEPPDISRNIVKISFPHMLQLLDRYKQINLDLVTNDILPVVLHCFHFEEGQAELHCLIVAQAYIDSLMTSIPEFRIDDSRERLDIMRRFLAGDESVMELLSPEVQAEARAQFLAASEHRKQNAETRRNLSEFATLLQQFAMLKNFAER